jgi:hypothetical protein
MKLDIKNLKTYIISPATGRYKERFEITLERLKTIGFTNVELFISIPAENGTESLTNTQYAILKKELDNDHPFIILEDDLGIHKDVDSVEIPDNYDALYLGVSKWAYPHSVEAIGNPSFHITRNSYEHSKDFSESLTKIEGVTSTHAILFKGREFIKRIVQTMNKFHGQRVYSDLIMAANHKYFNVYALKVPLFYQDASIGGQQEPTYMEFYAGKYRYVPDIADCRAGRRQIDD